MWFWDKRFYKECRMNLINIWMEIIKGRDYMSDITNNQKYINSAISVRMILLKL